ncbi:hypothetical protein F5Y16DRAFT_282973 [Xylariaceae sp. FL0255]|nr:hypothetical protein F5Y16DRAFT_282973 [Xylariaceae sp. FL0255]
MRLRVQVPSSRGHPTSIIIFPEEYGRRRRGSVSSTAAPYQSYHHEGTVVMANPMDPVHFRAMNPGHQIRSMTPAGHNPLAPRGMTSGILNGLCLEAARAEEVNRRLQLLRNCLQESMHPILDALIGHIHVTARSLRDLADRSLLYIARVPALVDYLNVLLPCLCRTLRDITTYYDDPSKTKENRWRTMYHSMTAELPGMTLPQRFTLYNDFLQNLVFLLTRSPNFDLNRMESLHRRILRLRTARQIDPPTRMRTEEVRIDTALDFLHRETDSHWAENIFTQPLPSRREFARRIKSDTYGEFQPMNSRIFNGDVKILVKRSFQNDSISVMIFQHADQVPHVLIRTQEPRNGVQWIWHYGIHELSIRRTPSSAVRIFNREQHTGRKRLWAKLGFATWEELVLFYNTFVCLKANSPYPQVDPREFTLAEETRVYHSEILDDHFHHQLNVIEDKETGGRRLQAVICDNSAVNGLPVWTAFIPSDIPDNYMKRKSDRKILLRDLQVYTFDPEYQPHHQRTRKYGDFLLHFRSSRAAYDFMQIFKPTFEASVESASEEGDSTPGEE